MRRLSPSIATMLTLMLNNFYAERAYKNEGKQRKSAVTGVIGALISKRFSSVAPKYNVCHDSPVTRTAVGVGSGYGTFHRLQIAVECWLHMKAHARCASTKRPLLSWI